MSSTKAPIIEEIVDQYFDEAAFLWSQRDAAAIASNYSLSDLTFLDERVEAHIDGLRVAGEYGWQLCKSGLDIEEPGTVFAAAVIAFESGDKERIDMVVDASSKSRAAFRAVVSGLGWMNDSRFKSSIIGMVSAKSRPYRRLGIAACGIRRINPRTYLDQAANSGDLFLKTLAFKAIGELKRTDLLPQLQNHFQNEDHECRFQAARSALLLGDKSALDTLSTFVLSQSKFTLPAMQIALRLVDGQKARKWLKTMSKDPEQRRQALIGIGIIGDPAFVPVLIKQMSRPEMARVAGEAFSLIMGIDLGREKLESDWPDGFEAGPDDDTESEYTDMDADEDLSWPDAGLVAQWWATNGETLKSGTRYLAGSPIATCVQLLKTGNQSVRKAAALEVAIMSPNSAYFNTKTPGHKQVQKL